MLGLPVEAAVASNQPDRYGTTSINRQDHNRRHHAVLKIWSDLLSMVHGDNYDANPAADDKHFTYSPTKEPDGTAYHRAPGGKHIIYDTKVGTALSTTAAGADMTKPAGAIAAFGNSVPNLWKLAKKDYATPLAANHRLVLLIHETSGALSPATRRQLCNLTGYIDIDTILARGAYLTWTNSSSVLTYFSQRLSLALHDHVACELLKSTKSHPHIVPFYAR